MERLWAMRRLRAKRRIDLALRLLWGNVALGLLMAFGGDLALLISVPVHAVWLGIFSAAIRRGESFARWWLGAGALVSAVWRFAEMGSTNDEGSLGGVLFIIAFAIVPGWLLLDGKPIEAYLREQKLHARYRARRARRGLGV